MGRLLRSLLIFCFLIGPATTASSAEESGAPGTTATIPAPGPIEEITVIGQRSLALLRRRIIEKEEEIYSFFNAQNTSDRLDIICTRRRPTGTYIKKRECEPRFLKALRVEKTRDARTGIGVWFDQYDLVRWSAQDFEKLQNEMLALMTSNKEFAEKVADLGYLTENYEAHREAMFSSQ